MTIRTFSLPMMLALLPLALGCQNKGPVPQDGTPSSGPAPAVASPESGGAHPGSAQDPHAGMGQDPHAGMALQLAPHDSASGSGLPDDSGMIDVGAISFKVPEKWKAQPPKSSMRRAQVMAEGSAGPGELIVFFFGPQGAGGAKANIERWVGQFSNTDGSPVTDAKQTSSQVAGFDVIKVEVAGQYGGGMGGPGSAQAGQRLLAAIVNTSGGPYYFKFLGPDATVLENAAAFDALLGSVVASP